MAKTDKEIVLTKFTSNKILSKEFTLENGEIVKKAAANMTSGHAEMLAMDMEEFVELLPTLKNDEALGFGIHDGERYDWQAGDAVIVENACVHEHCNTESDEEAVVLVFKAKPLFLFMHLLFQKMVKYPPKDPPEGFEDYTPPTEF